MKQVRNSVFETNSSSTHSLVISKHGDNIKDYYINEELVFGEYGWEVDSLRDPSSKAEYLLTTIQYVEEKAKEIPYLHYVEDGEQYAKNKSEYYKLMFEAVLESKYTKWILEVIESKTGITPVLGMLQNTWHPLGYIDHQSLSPSIFEDEFDLFSMSEIDFKNKVDDILFDNKYVIYTDNDNH